MSGLAIGLIVAGALAVLGVIAAAVTVVALRRTPDDWAPGWLGVILRERPYPGERDEPGSKDESEGAGT